MSGKIFVDTNILVYAFSKSICLKKEKALEILDNSKITISTQVVREFISVGTTKYKQPLLEIIRDVENISNLASIINEDMGMIERGVAIYQRYNFRFYDCLIIAAALKAGCKTLLSEDMQHGQVIEDMLKIVNPFV